MTTLDDATCYALFFPPGKSLISEAEKIRWSMAVIKALYQQGLFSNLTISPTEPGDQTKLWLDESTDPDTLKVYNTGQWRSVASVGGDEAFKKLFPSALLTLAPGFVTTAMIANNAVTYAKMQQVAASSLVGNPTGALANAQGITLGATLAFSGSALQTAAITGDVTASANSFATTLATNVVSNAKFRQSAALSVVGNSTGSTANVADIAGIADQVLRVNGAGTALAFGAIDLSKTAAATGVLQAASFPAMTGDVTTVAGALASTIAANAVTNAKFRQGAGLSVVGVTGGSTANVADIVGTANQVLRVNSAGTALAFGSINLASSAAVTGTLAAVNGGTGLASFAVGDLLQANTTTTLAALAAVATGNALISGGVGVVSAWGKIGLTTHVSGTLAVGNGGTGATTLTAHGVLIGNGTGAIVAAAVGATGSVLAGSTGADPSFITLSAAIDTISANWGDILFRGTSGWIALAAGASGKYLKTLGAGADPVWDAVAGAGGTVSSVAVSGGTTGLTTSGGPITTTGTITLAGTLIAANGGTGFASYAVGDLLYADTTTTLAKLAKNASASRYLSNSGASNIPAWAQVDLSNGVTGNLAVGNLASGTGASATTFWRGDGTWVTPATGDFQEFNASGTWTKPSGFAADSYVLIEVWGGGGSGARGASFATNIAAGGGACYMCVWKKLSALGSTETVTIGAGGAATNTTGAGNNGGNTTFGTHITGYGGKAGATGNSQSNGGGTYFSGVYQTTNINGGHLHFGAIGNGSSVGTPDVSQNAIYGGGGGGGVQGVAGGSIGGTSQFGGAGGFSSTASGVAAVAGSQPGGGGGAGCNAFSGAGGDGRCRVTVLNAA